jgi:hypothetical protein
MRAKVDNNVITLYIDITFESDTSNETLTKLCKYLQGQLQPVSDMQFQQCVLPTGTRYSAGNTVTMQLLSTPLTDNVDGGLTGNVAGGATGLVSSILLIGFSYLLHL